MLRLTTLVPAQTLQARTPPPSPPPEPSAPPPSTLVAQRLADYK